MPGVFIILLNWNGWRDTVQCLESVLRSRYRDFRVVVCDNQSTDGSMEKIKSWADGALTVEEHLDPALEKWVSPPLQKPVPYVEYTRAGALAGGDETAPDVPLVLIQNGTNDGYSAGNNVGIRYALQRGAQYVWLLNNDTLVTEHTLGELVEYTRTHSTGVTGSVIYFVANPGQVQTWGGGTIGAVFGLDRFLDSPGAVDYVSGTSLFVTRDALEDTGLLDEGFFFYWEDVDFSRRVRGTGRRLGVADRAMVYHRFSSSVGGQSLKSDLFKVASLIRYFRKHRRFWWFVPVSFHLKGMVFKRLLRGQLDRIGPILRTAFHSLIRHRPPFRGPTR